LGFGLLRTLEGQFRLLGGRTLQSVVRTYGGDHRTYALQTVQVDIRGTTKHTLLFEYSLVNTWTYEVAFGPLGKNHRTYAPLAGRPLFFGPINTPYPLRVLHKFQTPLDYLSVSRVF
jgi:hypothetical protein